MADETVTKIVLLFHHVKIFLWGREGRDDADRDFLVNWSLSQYEMWNKA